MAAETLPTLPDPQEVEQAVALMRESVQAHDRRWAEQIDYAHDLIREAEGERAQLRENYPSMFPEAQKRVGHAPSEVSNASKNLVLRSIAEHPLSTRPQVAKRVSYSPSWVSTVVKAINEDGQLIERVKRGRGIAYNLSEQGRSWLDRGGYHE